MSVKKEASGRRSVQVEVEVPGTPEQVWQAIATGPGVSSWFVPTESEERVGGAVVAHFGPGMDSTATVTAWDPPHRFAAESACPGGTTSFTKPSSFPSAADTRRPVRIIPSACFCGMRRGNR